MARDALQIFDEWMVENTSPAANFTFAQYGRYVEGWRGSMPWAWKGMPVAFDQWASSRWEPDSYPDHFRLAWRMALAMKARSHFGEEPTWVRNATLEEVADFALSMPGTIVSMVAMGVVVLGEHRSVEVPVDTVKELAGFLADRMPALLKLPTVVDFAP